MTMAPSRRKKIIVLSAAFVLVVVAAVVVLIGLSNRFVKHELEQALGENFRVEGISLSWGGIEVNQPRFLRDGQTAASAEKITLKADFLAILRRDLTIARVVLEKPSLQITISPEGNWVLPFDLGKNQEAEPAAKPVPFAIKRIEISDGTLIVRDQRFREPSAVEVQKINASLDDFSIPFRNRPSKFLLQFQLAGKLASGFVSGSGTFNFETIGIDASLSGQDLAFLDGDSAEPVLRIGSTSCKVSSEGMPAGPLVLSDLLLTRPYLRLETDRKGNMINPLPLAAGTAAGTTKEEKKSSALQLEVKNFRIDGGEWLFLDGKVAKKPYPVRLNEVSLEADTFSLPLKDRSTSYRFSARVPGKLSTGALSSAGKTNLKTRDTKSKVSVSDLDLTGLKPYIVKEGDVDISRGFLDLNVDLDIRNRTLHAPAHSVIRDLEFVTGRGLKDRFLGIPRSLVVNAMETGNHRIEFDFILEGSLENPKFNFRESLVMRFTAGLAKTLGLSVIEAGETVIIQGGRAIKGAGKGLKKIGEGLQKIFK